jgi:hypothetical protein
MWPGPIYYMFTIGSILRRMRRLSWQGREGNGSSWRVSYIRNKGRYERGMVNSVIGEGGNKGWYERGMMNSIIMNKFCYRREMNH